MNKHIKDLEMLNNNKNKQIDDIDKMEKVIFLFGNLNYCYKHNFLFYN